MFYHEIYYIINHQIMSNQIMSNQDFSSLQQIFGFSKCSNFFEEKKKCKMQKVLTWPGPG